MNKINPTIHTKLHGFTIVELLIVIVVIAILAAISIAAYTNIQQRAKNTAIINAANSSIKLIEAYIAQYGVYPRTWTGELYYCITDQCAGSYGDLTSDASLNNNLAKVGIPPRIVPGSGNRRGIVYQYYPAAFIDGVSQPLIVAYWLEGQNKNCGMSGVVNSSFSSLSTTGYTDGNHGDSGKTFCRISVPGPAHS